MENNKKIIPIVIFLQSQGMQENFEKSWSVAKIRNGNDTYICVRPIQYDLYNYTTHLNCLFLLMVYILFSILL